MANYADTTFDFPQSGSTGETSKRLPWNNVIFPGNQVTHLNAYRDQGVQAYPGVNFFRLVGAISGKDLDDAMGTDGDLDTGTYSLKILSPDLRQDDKPRQDRNFVINASAGGGGVVVYRVAINVVNLKGTGSSTITTDPTAVGGATQITLADGADGLFPQGGEFSAFTMDTLPTAVTSDITVQATVGGAALTKVDPNSEAAILVEVCFFMNAPAPDEDDVHLPYYTESGSSSQ